MTVEDQSAAIAFLASPGTHGGERVERIDTHCSILFLAGDRAFKLKRAVRYSYLDYSTRALREAACRNELALNRRTAPEIYLAVRSIARSTDGRLGFDATGDVLDWVVVMRRFDAADTFDRLAESGRLTPELVVELAARVAEFHRTAAVDRDRGGRAALSRIAESNAVNLRDQAPPLDAARVEAVVEGTRRALEKVGALLDRRREAGKVRLCHGDLHLRNVCLFEGRATLFDCVEFSRDLATIDLLYDLAFLLMDLGQRGLTALANALFNRYLDLTGDGGEGLGTLPLFLSLRAAVRAHVEATAGRAQPSAAAAAAQAAAARDYLEAALRLLESEAPSVIAIGGLSGTGKSTIARLVAPAQGRAPGGRVLRSDVLRKRLMGVAPEARLPESAYGEEATARVYRALLDEAGATVAAGQSVVLDAVFARPEERTRAEAVARAAGVPFRGLWLSAEPKLLEARIQARSNDASDATAAVLRRQLAYDCGRIGWVAIDASGDLAATQALAERALAARRP